MWPLFTNAYHCLLLFTIVNHCLPLFTSCSAKCFFLPPIANLHNTVMWLSDSGHCSTEFLISMQPAFYAGWREPIKRVTNGYHRVLQDLPNIKVPRRIDNYILGFEGIHVFIISAKLKICSFNLVKWLNEYTTPLCSQTIYEMTFEWIFNPHLIVLSKSKNQRLFSFGEI